MSIKYAAIMMLWLVGNLLLSYPVQAKRYHLTVIQDESNNTIPVDRYMSDQLKPPKESPVPARTEIFNPFDYGFPIRSTKWKPGTFDSKQIKEDLLPMNFYVLGCNAESFAWLDERKQDLQKLSVMGFVIQCDDHRSLDELKAYAEPLKLLPMEANMIGDRLKHYVYPALITKTSIEQ